ncbi:hypothetical protein MMA231_01585 [Asticcacaulis sp. MM231]|uniref:DUF805 domain-containing protein n=1 Tax=Asticcacaulis sp. MM231 TaxID=3157666 RepID=UPI0032D56CEF
MPESQAKFRFWWFFFSLAGRLARKPFIAFALPMKLIAIAILLVRYAGVSLTPLVSLTLVIFQLAFAWPQYAVTIKRLHDVGRSALFALHIPIYLVVWVCYLVFFNYVSRTQPFNFLPYVIYNFTQYACLLYSFILFLVLAIIPGTQGRNRYGPHPHRPDQSASEVF